MNARGEGDGRAGWPRRALRSRRWRSSSIGPSRLAISPIRRQLRRILPARKIDAECQRLVDELRKRCPEAFPPDPLEPSGRGPDLPLGRRQLTTLVRLAAQDGIEDRQLWQRDGDELLVDVARIALDTRDGVVVVTIPVTCDQTGPARIQVAFAVGSRERPAGMVAAAERHPRGPAVVVEGWADELTALAWRALTAGVTSLAGEAGEDADGAGLVPFGIEASDDGLVVRTMARHAFDRVRR